MNHQVLQESKTLRDELVECCYVLDKIKKIEYLGDNAIATIDMASEFYEVSAKTIESHLLYHKEEFEADGLKVLSGADFKEFKGLLEKQGKLSEKIKFAPSLTILSRRALLRLGMLLRDSKVAQEVRTYLLDTEKLARLSGIVARRAMTDAIKEFVPDGPEKEKAYPSFTNLVYTALFGGTSFQLKKRMKLGPKSNLRDHLKASDLKMIENVEREIYTLLSFGFDHDQIGVMLKKKYSKSKVS